MPRRLSADQRTYLLDHLRRSSDPKLVEIADVLGRRAGKQPHSDRERELYRVQANVLDIMVKAKGTIF